MSGAGGAWPRHFRAPDGRLIAIHTRPEETDFGQAPPESDPSRAGLTPVGWPLQAMLMEREPGVGVRPHYHVNEAAAASATRHSVFVCLSGLLVVEIYSREGDHVGTAELDPGDVLVVAEGHSVNAGLPHTRALEVKQGPHLPYASPDVVSLEVNE